MGWYILGCIVFGVFGFLISAICTIAKRSDANMHTWTTPTENEWLKPLKPYGTRAERRRQWRQSWLDMKREV